MTIQWYFDYVSPFSYLQWVHQMPRVDNGQIDLKPVLFAGLLKHWGHIGPAEIVGKRRFTNRYVVWLAGRLGVPFCMPAAHPFNPLPLLRLSIALHNKPETVDRLFSFVWHEGHVPTQERAWRQLLDELEIVEESLEDSAIKQQLRENTEEAIAKDVFGVPTFVSQREIFWGVDSFEFLLDYLDNSGVLDSPEMRAADSVPSGV